MQLSRKQASKAPPLSTNIQRKRIRPARVKSTGKGMTYSVSLETSNIVTNVGGTATSALTIDPQYYLSRQLGVVSSTFQFYKFTKFNVTWVPLVGATVGGVIRMAYTDNPEVIYKTYAGTYTAADLLSLTQQSQHNRRFPIWQESSFALPNQLMNRRPKFSIDSSPATNAEIVDRVSQALGIFQVSGPASTTLGYFALDITVEFMEPLPTTSSPLFFSSDLPGRKDCAEYPMYEEGAQLD